MFSAVVKLKHGSGNIAEIDPSIVAEAIKAAALEETSGAIIMAPRPLWSKLVRMAAGVLFLALLYQFGRLAGWQ